MPLAAGLRLASRHPARRREGTVKTVLPDDERRSTQQRRTKGRTTRTSNPATTAEEDR